MRSSRSIGDEDRRRTPGQEWPARMWQSIDDFISIDALEIPGRHVAGSEDGVGAHVDLFDVRKETAQLFCAVLHAEGGLVVLRADGSPEFSQVILAVRNGDE